MKKIIALILVVLMMSAALVSCGGPVEDLAYVKENGKLVVGVTVYKPMDYKDEMTIGLASTLSLQSSLQSLSVLSASSL